MTATATSFLLSLFVYFVIFSLAVVSALEITEIELNPEGDDPGNEWVELFSEDEIDLKGYYLENNDGVIYNLTGDSNVSIVFPGGYLPVTFENQWLDNKDERIFLKKEGVTIDQTKLFNDEKNDDRAWSKCDGEWKFLESTKEKENTCATEETGNNSTEAESSNDTDLDENNPVSEEDITSSEETRDSDKMESNTGLENSGENKSPRIENLASKGEKVVLNGPSDKTEKTPRNETDTISGDFISPEEFVRNFMVYSFLGLILLLAILVIWKKL